ncbi:hypothetical protein IQ07DRAFT_537394 [Pyrenochaeta sp. DS3sAY3a]|nr:hypothetical protein IQ07DRAFT_537394 [Pyrenochaeta sp. DS3sAY3a]
MAGVRAPSTFLTSCSPLSVRSQDFSRYLRIGQSLRPTSSRALYTRVSSHGCHSRRAVLSLGYGLSKSTCAARFINSTSRQLKPEDGKGELSQPLSPKDRKKQTLTAKTAQLASSLKTTLKLDNTLTRHEKVWNIPNILTFSRLIATPAVGYLIIHNHHLYAFSLFAYAAFSDLLDGWIARRWNLQTVVGSVVDPMADKFLMTTLVTCLAVNGSLPMPLFALILGRDVSLAVAAIYYRYASLPAPKTLARYWDFSLPSAEVHPTTISKFNTFLQLSLLGTLLCTNLLHDPSATSSAAGGLLLSVQELLGGEDGVRTMIQGMSAVVASTTIYSGLEYTWSKKAVVILGGDEALKRKQGFRGRMIMAGGFGSFIAVAAWLWYKEHAKVADDNEEKGQGR